MVQGRNRAGFTLESLLCFAPGQHAYKFVLNGDCWLDDPGSPRKAHDGSGGFKSLFIRPYHGHLQYGRCLLSMLNIYPRQSRPPNKQF
jgi:hypothetical protein